MTEQQVTVDPTGPGSSTPEAVPVEPRPGGHVPTGTATDAVPCPACAGQGEHGIRQDYWGNWETKQCPACGGMAEVTPDRAAEIVADLAERDDA